MSENDNDGEDREEVGEGGRGGEEWRGEEQGEEGGDRKGENDFSRTLEIEQSIFKKRRKEKRKKMLLKN